MILTLPPRGDPGSCLIAVDGQAVGHVLQGYNSWTAYLWPKPEKWDPFAPVITGPRLRDIRAALNERLSLEGPWWRG